MKSLAASLAFGASLALAAPAWADQPANSQPDKVRVEIESVGLHPGMQPGMYVCAAGHLHLKGTVQNLTAAPLGKVKVGGKAFDADGNLLGTATASTRKAVLSPGERAEINIEFLTVLGALVEKVDRHEVTVLEVPSKPQ